MNYSTMEKIIDPVSVDLLKAELTPDKKLRDSNKGGNEIYVINHHNSPNLMREIARLREISFRDGGGGTGMEMDIDEFDTMEKPYEQIMVWDPDAEAIIGGYRYILGPDVTFRENGQPNITSADLFHYSDTFIKDYLPHVIELGRSFVTPEYQSSKAGAKALFAMDNLWDGISAVIMLHPNIMYMLGKMTMYPSFNRAGRDLILHFLWKHFGDKEELVRPYNPVMPVSNGELMDLILCDKDFRDDYKNLKEAIHRLGTNIPPLINSYMNTSPSMKMFGTTVYDEFGSTEETGILVCFNEMYPEKRARHVDSFLKNKMQEIRGRFPNLAEDFEQKISERWNQRRDNAFSRFLHRRGRQKRKEEQ